MKTRLSKLINVIVVVSLLLTLVGQVPVHAASSFDATPQVRPPDPKAQVTALTQDPQSQALEQALGGMPLPDGLDASLLGVQLPSLGLSLPGETQTLPQDQQPDQKPGPNLPKLPSVSGPVQALPLPDFNASSSPASTTPDKNGTAFNQPAKSEPATSGDVAPSETATKPAAQVKNVAQSKLTSNGLDRQGIGDTPGFVVYLPLVVNTSPVQTETGEIKPGQSNHIAFDQSNFELDAPTGAVSAVTQVQFEKLAPESVSEYSKVLYRFKLTAQVGGKPVTQFGVPLAVTISYTEIGELAEQSLSLYYRDPQNNEWIALPSQVDTKTNQVIAMTDHFTEFALLATYECEDAGIWLAVASHKDAFIRACNRVGRDTLGYPFYQSNSGAFPAVKFQNGGLVYNAQDDEAYFLQGEIYTLFQNHADSLLGVPLRDTVVTGPPDTYRDENNDFRNNPFSRFAGGFIGTSQQGTAWHRYFPQIQKIHKTAETVEVDLGNGQKQEMVQMGFGAEINPAPDAFDMVPANATLYVELSTGETWERTATSGPASVHFEYPDLVPPDTTVTFHWSLDRQINYVLLGLDGLIGYAPCLYYDFQVPYSAGALASFEKSVGCGNGGGDVVDTTPPTIKIIEVWPDGQGNLSIKAEITDDSGQIASTSISGAPGSLKFPQMVLFAPDVYADAFLNVPNGEIVDFTITATDPSGNTASANGDSRSPLKNYYGLSCAMNPCGGGFDAAVGNPTLMSSGNKVEQLPVLYIPGPGDSSIVIELTYNAQNSDVSIVGQGWSFPYQMRLTPRNNLLLVGVEVTYPDGRLVTFSDNGDGTFTPVLPHIHDRLEKRGNEYILIMKSLAEYEFNANGQMTVMRDRNGNAIHFTYAGDKLTRIENSGGRWVNITYNAQGFISDLDAPEDTHYAFGYTGNRLTSFTDPAGNIRTFEYEERHIGTLLDVQGQPYDAYDYYLTATKMPEGNFKNQQNYDEKGRVIEQWVGEREHRIFTYDEGARTTTVTDAYNQITIYRYDEKWRLVRIDYAGGTYESFGYDDNFNRTYFRDRNSNEYRYSFDDDGNKLTEDGPLGWHREWQYTALNLVERFAEKLDAARVRVMTFTYDAKGNLTDLCNPYHCSSIAYDTRGLPTLIKDFAGNPTTNTYDAEGDLTASENGETETTKFNHDDLGRMTDMWTPLDYHYTYAYDKIGHLTDINGPLTYHLGYTYDPNGNLETSTDPNGGVTSYTHDASENILTVTGPLGYVTAVYTYGPMNELATFTDAKNRLWEYSYDDALRLTDIYGPLETHTHLAYDAVGNLTDVTDSMNRVTHSVYDALNRPTSVTLNYQPGQPESADTNVDTAYEYNIVGDVLKVTDAEDHPTVFEYDLLSRMTSQRDVLSQETSYEYDEMSNISVVTNPRGVSTTFDYDKANRLITLTENFVAGAPADSRTNVVTQYRYDDDGNLSDQVDPLGVVTHYIYNDLDRPVTEIRNYRPGVSADWRTNVTTGYKYDLAGNLRFVTDPRNYVAEYRYDAAMRLIESIDFGDGHTIFTYDKVDNLLTVTDDNQHTTSYGYDDLDRRTSISNPEDHAVSFTYNKLGQLTDFEDANGNPTHYDLDALGRVEKMVDALLGEWRYRYNRVGSLLEKTDANGHATHYVYDEVYRLLNVTDAEGKITAFLWDKNGNLTTRTDCNQHATTYEYDPLDRLTALTNPEEETTGYEYDPLGNQVRLIEADNTVTLYGYDELYRLVAVTENYRPGESADNDTNVVTRYEYDASGNLRLFTNARGYPTTFTHDGMGRLTKEVNAKNNTWDYTYDKVGNLLTRVDAKRQRTTYAYFDDDQLRRIDYQNSQSVGYTYDENNNRLTMQDSLGKTTWVYDELNRVESVTDPFGRALHYQLDAVGNRIALQYPDGLWVMYAYMDNNWLETMTDPAGNVTTYTRDDVGNILVADYPNDILTTISYDDADRVLTLVNQQTVGAKKTNSAFSYTYNEVGHVTQVVNTYGWRNPPVVTENYTYDGLHRLVGMSNSEGVVMSYAYDKAGNRTGWTTNDDLATQTPRDGFVAAYSFNEINQLTQASVDSEHNVSDVLVDFTYDANGNRVNKEWGGPQGPKTQGVDYSYDPENRLVSALDYQHQGNKRVDRALTTLAYDGGGRRLVQTYDPKTGPSGEKRTEYTFDGLDPVAEYSMLNGQRDNFYRGAGGRIVMMHNFKSGTQGQMYWYSYNFKGDVVGLSKQSGQSTHNYRYDPYGGVLPDTGNFTDPHNHYTLTGKEYDENTGLTYFGARHYDSQTAGWMTQDTFRGRQMMPVSMNRYAYVHGNPITYNDSYGYCLGGLIGDKSCWETAIDAGSKILNKAADTYDAARDDVRDYLGVDNKINQSSTSIPLTNVAEAVVLSLLGEDKVEVEGDALRLIQSDPAMIEYENNLIKDLKNDPRYGKGAFNITFGSGIEFGGQRAPGDMWTQLKHPFDPLYKDTWRVATNELTWLIRHANINGIAMVDENGCITISYTLTDRLDLRPGEGRSSAYNTITQILGMMYHDIARATELEIEAKWTNHYP